MKTKVFNAARVLLLTLFVPLVIHSNAQTPNHNMGNPGASALQFSVSIPDAVQPQIVRQDFENESIFNFKNGNGKQAFLFSVSKVTAQQWMSIKASMKNYSIIENKDGNIVFVQKTDQLRIKGDNEQYQSVLQQLDAMIASVHMT